MKSRMVERGRKEAQGDVEKAHFGFREMVGFRHGDIGQRRRLTNVGRSSEIAASTSFTKTRVEEQRGYERENSKNPSMLSRRPSSR